MEPVTLVVTALLAGAGLGVGNVASSVVMDAYQGLKGLVLARLRGAGTDTGAGEMLLTQLGGSPGRQVALTEALTVAGVDDLTVDAARKLLELIEAQQKGKFIVDASQAKGVVIGDHSIQNNTFN